MFLPLFLNLLKTHLLPGKYCTIMNYSTNHWSVKQIYSLAIPGMMMDNTKNAIVEVRKSESIV